MHVISLGGSLVFNHGVNVSYYSGLVRLIKRLGGKYIFVLGGGTLAREYIQAAKKLKIEDTEVLDTLGILATHMNAWLFNFALNQAGVPAYHTRNINQEPVSVLKNHRVIVTGGTQPGQTTDMVSVICCKRLGVKSLINITDVGCIYDSDPKVNPNAKFIHRINASDLLKMWDIKHKPGMNLPFEPKAAKEAMNYGITVNVIGSDLKDLENTLLGRKHSGTVIVPR